MKKNEQFENFVKIAKDQSLDQKAPDHIWENISARLSGNSENKIKNFIYDILTSINKFLSPRRVLSTVAVATISIILISTFFTPQLISLERTAKLATAIDDRIFSEHQKYENVITDLNEDYSKIDLFSGDQETVVYIEKLTAIDMIISKCKSALEINPYSVEVNTSLVSAFQEKITTLNFLINSNTRIS